MSLIADLGGAASFKNYFSRGSGGGNESEPDVIVPLPLRKDNNHLFLAICGRALVKIKAFKVSNWHK